MPSMSSKILAISVIVLVAVIMGFSAVTPAMAGNHGTSPPDDRCDAVVADPVSSKDGGNNDAGKAKAAEVVCD